jgi:hypothetical protein
MLRLITFFIVPQPLAKRRLTVYGFLVIVKGVCFD